MTKPSSISTHILPRGATISESGELQLHGFAVSEIARKFGTPVFVYDAVDIVSQAKEVQSVADWDVAYASKAFLCLELVKMLSDLGLYLDVASGGELHVAVVGGFDPAKVVFHGNNKSDKELFEALKAGVGIIVVDSHGEISRLEAIAKSLDLTQDVLVRVTPGVEAHTHEYVMTGQEDSKFGFSVSSGAADIAIENVIGSDFLKYRGIHAHIGSQIFLLDSYAKEVEALASLLVKYPCEILNLGGGLGVAYIGSETSPGFEAWAKRLMEAIVTAGVDPSIRIMVEPGRALVARAAMTVYRVGTIKELPDVRTYVSVDGGMSDNPRPVLYGSGYEAVMVTGAHLVRDRLVTIVGKHCESGDMLIKDAYLPRCIAEGDLIATPMTGAYGYSMASNYNRVPRPPVVFVDELGPRLVIRGETYEDLLRLEV